MTASWENEAPAAEPEVKPAGEDAPQLVFGSVDEFVREYLRKVYRPRIDGRRRFWAADWWNYPEAVARLTALWRAWEHLRLDPGTGSSIWWRDHFDHHMAVLTGPEGPFSEIPHDQASKSTVGDYLPYTEPPAGDFPDEREIT